MRRRLAVTFGLVSGLLFPLVVAPAFAADPSAADSAPDLVADNRLPPVDAYPTRPHARERLVEIRKRIQAALRYPPLARERNLEGTVLMRFDLDHAGVPHEVVVHASSGLASLDRAATAAVADAAPLPWVYGRLEVPVLFSLENR